MQKRKKHSKFRNTGILFELLTRQITSDIIAGKKTSHAKDLLFNYFNEKTNLGKEWQLYNTLLERKTKGEKESERLLGVVVDTRKKISNKKLNQEKYNLIKEIKDFYPLDDLLKCPIKNYKTLASIYKILENSSSTEDAQFGAEEIFQANECILENMIKEKPTKEQLDENSEDHYISYLKKHSEDIRLLTYKLLLEKFNNKYSVLFDDDQKSLLKEYICNIANTNSSHDLIVERVNKLCKTLSSYIKNIKNEVTKIKVNEVIKQLGTIKESRTLKDNHVTVLLLSYELVKECKKNI